MVAAGHGLRWRAEPHSTHLAMYRQQSRRGRSSFPAGSRSSLRTRRRGSDPFRIVDLPQCGLRADGSVGRCQNCHLRHTFSLEQARNPETCNDGHIGPDHPQWEIYQESPHGISYMTGGHTWNWEAEPGTPTTADIPAATCATCHISGSARPSQPTMSAIAWPGTSSPRKARDDPTGRRISLGCKAFAVLVTTRRSSTASTLPPMRRRKRERVGR